MKSIMQFHRDKNRNRRGVLVAEKIDDSIIIGWSMCKTKVETFDFETNTMCKTAVDTFDKDKGIAIAQGRIQKRHSDPLPHSMTSITKEFVNRAKRYFKTDEVTVLGVQVIKKFSLI